MISLQDAADVIEEFDDAGIEIAGRSTGIGVVGNSEFVSLMMQYPVWEDGDGSEWTRINEKDVATTKEELREAIVGELEVHVEFFKALIARVVDGASEGEPNG